MSATVLVLEEPNLQGHQTQEIELLFQITGAKTAVLLGVQPGITYGFDTPGSATAALGQTTIDNLLGSVNEFVAATAFGSTAMGTDAFGFVLNCKNQVSKVYAIEATWAELQVTGVSATLANTLPATPVLARVAVSSLGNLGGQLVITGLDAATAGLLKITMKVLCGPRVVA